MSYNDPKLRARLNDSARPHVSKHWTGKHQEHCNHQIGITNIHVEQGNMFAQINWGIDGLDSPVSQEILQFVEFYEITQGHGTKVIRAEGVYVLWTDKKRNKTALARARITTCSITKNSDFYVSGAKREDVVKLFELIRDGKIRPDVEQNEFDQIEGVLGKFRRLERLVPMLESRLESKNMVNIELSRRLNDVRTQLAGVQRFAAAA